MVFRGRKSGRDFLSSPEKERLPRGAFSELLLSCVRVRRITRKRLALILRNNARLENVHILSEHFLKEF